MVVGGIRILAVSNVSVTHDRHGTDKLGEVSQERLHTASYDGSVVRCNGWYSIRGLWMDNLLP